MTLSQRLTINAGVLSAILVMQTLTYSLGFSRLILFYGVVGVALLWVNRVSGSQFYLIDVRNQRLVLAWAVALILMHIARESVDFGAFVGDRRMGIKLGLAELATATTLLVLAMAYRKSGGMVYFLATVVLGISGYVVLNVVLEVTGWMPGAVEEGFQSRYTEGALRWMPPLAKSNGLFSLLDRYTLAVGVLLLVFHWRTFAWPIRLAIATGLGACVYAAVVLEHRAVIIPIIVAPAAYALARTRFRRIIPSGMLAAMVLIPVLVGTGWWETNADKLIPVSIFEVMGDPETVYNFSGRDSIYDYGMEYLMDFKMGFFGDGPVFRDSLPGFPEANRLAYEATLAIGSAPQTFAFHNGFLDVFISHGPLLGSLVFGFFGASIVILGRAALAHSQGGYLGLTSLAVLLAVNVLDSGFADINLFFIAIFGTTLAIAEATDDSTRGRDKRVRATSPVPVFAPKRPLVRDAIHLAVSPISER